MSTLSRFMAFGSQARLYIIKLRNCLNNNVDLAVPFTKHNFGCFGRIFFVIVLFESLSKTLFRVLFSRLYHQIWILLPYLHFWSDCEKIPIGCLYCMTLQMPEMVLQVKVQPVSQGLTSATPPKHRLLARPCSGMVRYGHVTSQILGYSVICR
jgi:hypothetical protein